MSLQRKGATWAFGTTDVTCDGITEVTGYSARREYGTQVEGIGADGEIGAFLYGKEKHTISVEGYAATGNPPAVGGNMSVKGISGTVMNVEVTGSNQDFLRVKVEGIGYPAIAGGA